MNYFFSFAVSLFSGVFCAGASGAVITLVTEHLKPFQVVSGDHVSGITTDIVRQTMDQASIDYRIEVHDWHIAYAMVLKEANTCVYSISRIKEREKQFHWIGRLMQLPTAFYSAADATLELSELDDARNFRTVVLKNDIGHIFLQRHGFIEGKHYYVSTNYRSLFTLLDTPSRNLDLLITSDVLLVSHFDNGEQANHYKKALDIAELTLDFYLACNLQTPQPLIDKLRDAMGDSEAKTAS